MTEFERIFCVVKRSAWEYHHADPQRAERFNRLSKAKQESLEASHNNQKSFLAKLQELTAQFELQVEFVSEREADSIHPTAKDLVIPCGGDGTFLMCAQNFGSSALLGMNSDYRTKAGGGSYGALTNSNHLNLAKRLKALVEGRYFIDLWSRLQVKVNGKLIPRLAVNDVYFGHRIAFQTCDIRLRQGWMEENFNCSGLIVCTGMGSHAWHYNAGGSPFSNELDAFGFRVLTPNLKRPMKFQSGVVSQRNELLIYPERDQYVLSFDSRPDVIETEMGDEIRISLATPDLAIRVVSFKD